MTTNIGCVDILGDPALDIHGGKVEICLNPDGRVWINIDGICRLRVSKPETVSVAKYGSQARLDDWFPKAEALATD